MTAFGMKVIDGVGPAIYLSDGYLNLAIIQKRGNYKEGLYHFGFEVENIEALRPVCKDLGAKTDIQKVLRIVKRSIGSTIRTARLSISHNTGGRFNLLRRGSRQAVPEFRETRDFLRRRVISDAIGTPGGFGQTQFLAQTIGISFDLT